jgi:hypothetical protein
MRIDVGPARRVGVHTAIYNEPLSEANLETLPDGDVLLTIDANGINCEKSRYRYKIRLNRLEADALARSIGKP